MRILLKSFLFLFSFLMLAGIVGAAGGVYVLWHYGKGLPDYKQLADYEPPTVTRIHAGDGRLVAEYAREKRVFVPAEAMPRELIHGFVAAEDQNFFKHYGVDPIALGRAVVTNVYYYFEGRRFIGASTITQQVAKNFLLTNEFSLDRKIKEAILSFRIERALSKERILELYLNEIYLGYGSYGVAAAALNYFNKSLDELTTAEIAYMAALPKAPSNYHPVRETEAAVARRNWVIGRMEEEGYIDKLTAARARAKPLQVVPREETDYVDAAYFVEEVRRELSDRYGPDGVTEGGLSVRTTLDPKLQAIAENSLRAGLEAYDHRHGYRGAVATIKLDSQWPLSLKSVDKPRGTSMWRLAAVLAVDEKGADIGFDNGAEGRVPFAELRWARKALENQRFGNRVRSPKEVVSEGDVILVEAVTHGDPPKEGADPVEYPPNTYALRQVPKINGALVALDPHTGRVLAMEGGWSYARSQFNRATQAKRQPGSSFKPFVYLSALDNGFTPATMILDAPFVIDQGPGLPKWKPANFSKKFYGPSPMRLGIEKSRNLMTVRLAQALGMETVAEYAGRFNVIRDMPQQLSMALGAGEVRLINMVAAYGMLVNGGKEITPSLIDRVQDRHGNTIFKHDGRSCPRCRAIHWDNQLVPRIADNRKQLTDPASAYQIVTMLEGVVKRGTGRRLRSIGKPLAGKTGTTNDSRDTWFIGFTPDLVVGTFIGFDTPKSLGKQLWGGQETGSSVAAPVVKTFMEQALKDQPAIPFRTPPGVRMVRIDAETGALAGPGSERVIVEAFKPGTEPSLDSDLVVISGGTPEDGTSGAPTRGRGGSQRGLY